MCRNLGVGGITGRERFLFWGLAASYGGFVALLLPARVIVMNDDFGYLRSVVETLRRGRLWTDDWLEPWAYSSSALSALAYRVFGSMYLATAGLQIVCAALLVFVLSRALRERGFSSWASGAVGLAIATVPTVLWKSLEYTSLVVYMPCLALAILCADRKHWLGFGLAYGMAVASRQSAVIWLLLPASDCLLALLQRRFREAGAPAIAAVSGGVLFGLIQLVSNRTHAQRVASPLTWTEAASHALQGWTVVAIVVLTAAGCGLLVSWLASAPSRRQSASAPLRQRILRGAFVVALGVLCFAWRSSVIGYEHSGYDVIGRVYGPMLWVAAGAGWALGPIRLEPRHAVTALGCAAVASVRAHLYDYYLFDAAVLAFFSTAFPLPRRIPSRKAVDRAVRLAAAIPAVLLLSLNASASIRLKEYVDYRAAACVLYEKALRAEDLDVSELDGAPFGLIAWHLYPYYIRHEGIDSAALDGFGMYLRPASPRIGIHGPEEHAGEKAAGRTIERECFPFGWVGSRAFELETFEATGDSSRPLAGARPSPFPLNEDEWRELVDADGP